MLYKDNELLKLEKQEIAKFSKPMLWSVPDQRFYVDPKTGKRRCGRSTHIASSYSYFDKEAAGGITHIQYVTRPDKPRNNEPPEHFPPYVEIGKDGIRKTKPNEWEINWLFFYSPRNQSGPNFDNNREPLFMLIDNAKAAQAKAEKIKEENEVYDLIWKDGLSFSKLKELARQMNVDADLETEDEIRVWLHDRSKLNPSGFLELAGSGKMQVASIVNEAIENGSIKYFDDKRSWHYINPSGKEVGLIINAGNDNGAPVDVLIKYLTMDRKGSKELDQIVKCNKGNS